MWAGGRALSLLISKMKKKKFKAWISSATKVRCIKLVYFQIRTRPTHLGTKAIVLIFGRVRLTILETYFNSLLVVESTSSHFRKIWKSGVPSKNVFVDILDLLRPHPLVDMDKVPILDSCFFEGRGRPLLYLVEITQLFCFWKLIRTATEMKDK